MKDWDLCPKWWSPLERHERRCVSELGRENLGEARAKDPVDNTAMVAPTADPDPTQLRRSHPAAQPDSSRSEQKPHIYTDGSGIDGKIGASAILQGSNLVKQAYLGTKTVSTVYIVELKGIQMALETAAYRTWLQRTTGTFLRQSGRPASAPEPGNSVRTIHPVANPEDSRRTSTKADTSGDALDSRPPGD
jgi:hypothetical protein